MPFFFWDPTYIFILIGLAISALASGYVKKTYATYSSVRSQKGLTATEVCRDILDTAGLHDVQIKPIRGHLTDNYNSQEKVLSLSDATRNSTSVAAIGVAAHEAGHALQDKENYLPLKLRASLVPITRFGQGVSFPLILIGALFGGNQFLINIGLILFSTTLVFQLVTLPVEFNASNRAIAILEDHHLLAPEELPQAEKVLKAAALTYIAAALASFLNVVRLFLLFGNNNNRRRR